MALLLFRLLWGFFGGHWSRFATFTYSPKASVRYLRGKNPSSLRICTLLDKPARRKGKDLPVLRITGRANVADKRLQTGEQLTATGEEGQPLRLTVQREQSFLKGPDFTP